MPARLATASIKGGAEEGRFKNWIEVSRSKVGFQNGCRPLIVKTDPNDSWPVLAAIAADPYRDIQSGTLVVRQKGGNSLGRIQRTYDFDLASVLEVDEDDEVQTVTIAFGSMTYTSQRQKKNGQVLPPVVTTIDCNAGT